MVSLTQVCDGHTVWYEVTDDERPGLLVKCKSLMKWDALYEQAIAAYELAPEQQLSMELAEEVANAD